MNPRHRNLVRAISAAALALSILWFIGAPDFEPLITALAGIAGLLSSRSGSQLQPDDRPSKSRKSIIVLPFDNMSHDPEDAYLSDGLSEEIITDLSKIEALRVISRSSARAARETLGDIRSIGKALGVQYVLEGSVRKSRDSLRITAQLVDTDTDEHLWAERYDGQLDDAFEIQESVSKAIAATLDVMIDPTRAAKPSDSSRVAVGRDPRAYDCYVRAREEVWRCTQESLDRAVLLLSNGLKIVGDHANLHAMLGQANFQYINMAIHHDPEYLAKSEASARSALELDESLALGHLVIGEVAWKRGRMPEAIRHMEKALSLDPSDPDTLLVLAYVYAFVGKSQAGRILIERLLSIDPLAPLNYGIQAYLELFDGKPERALAPSRKMYAMDPESPTMRWIHTVMLAWNGRLDESPWDLRWARQVQPKSTLEALCKLINLAVVEDPAGLRVFTPEFSALARWDEQFSWLVGACYAKLGETDLALDWLENAVDRGFLNYPFLSADDPFLEGLRTNVRFQALMKSVAVKWRSLDQ